MTKITTRKKSKSSGKKNKGLREHREVDTGIEAEEEAMVIEETGSRIDLKATTKTLKKVPNIKRENRLLTLR